VVGKRNVGKSRFVNTLIGREVSAVSEIAGTTIDPIKNPLELLPYGPVLIVDTAGIDDEGELGSGRITQTIRTISSADFVLFIIDGRNTLSNKEFELLSHLDRIDTGYIIVVNKIEFGVNEELLKELKELRVTHFEVSCKEEVGFEELKRKIIRMLPRQEEAFSHKDLIGPTDKVVMVLPSQIDIEQRKFLLSQIEILKSKLDVNTSIINCDEKELREKLKAIKVLPDIIITESYLVNTVAGLVPDKVKITTFGILINRLKTKLPVFINGLKSISRLLQGDKILFAEGCNDHPSNNCRLKIKEWLYSNSKKELNLDFIFDEDLPENLSEYKLLVHCDGCKLNHTEMQTRINEAKLMDVPIVTYGIVASYMKGAIPIAVAPLGIKSV
jgi:[FeFe] hydrogenase H-cluster maturation GTPase HydF